MEQHRHKQTKQQGVEGVFHFVNDMNFNSVEIASPFLGVPQSWIPIALMTKQTKKIHIFVQYLSISLTSILT